MGPLPSRTFEDLVKGRRPATKVTEPFHTSPIPEIAGLGRNLRR